MFRTSNEWKDVTDNSVMENGKDDSNFLDDSDVDILLASEGFPFVCKDDIFGNDMADNCERELQCLLSTRSSCLTTPAMGRGESTWESSLYSK